MRLTQITILSMIVIMKPTKGSLSKEVEDFERNDGAMRRCIDNIIESNFNSNEHVMYAHWNRNVTALTHFGRIYQMQVYNQHTNPGYIELTRYIAITAYVIVVGKDNFAEVLKILRSMDRWNARAKFVVVLEGTLDTSALHALIGYYVTNVIVVQSDDLQMFTYFPYTYENLRSPFLEPHPLGICNRHGANQDLDMSKHPRVPKQWRNTTVMIAYMDLEPYTINVTAGTGLEMQLMELMKWFMKYNVSYSSVYYPDWGVYYPENHSYSGPVGAVQQQTADFVLGHFHLREEERLVDFDTTFSYMDDDLCWSAPYAEVRSHFQNIMHIFDRNAWILTSCALFLAFLAWHIFMCTSPNAEPAAVRYYSNPLCSMEVPFVAFVGLPILHEPKAFTLRFLFLVIILSCFVLVTGWKSYLIYSLTHEVSEFQVSNLKELVESNLIFGIYAELVDLHCADGTPESDFVCRTADRDLCDASNDCLDRSAFRKDMATIGTKRIFRYMAPQRYRSTTGRELIYVFKECLGKDYTVQYYSKGHPLFERSSELLMWIRTSGFIQNLDKRLDHSVQLDYHEFVSSLSTFHSSVLGLMHLHGIFLMLLAGLGISCLAFILELATFRYRRKIKIYRIAFYRCFKYIFNRRLNI